MKQLEGPHMVSGKGPFLGGPCDRGSPGQCARVPAVSGLHDGAGGESASDGLPRHRAG